MSTVEATVEVDVPVTMAYNQWTQFESFPRFMNGVEEVRQIDDIHNHWVVKVGGVRREFDTEITEQFPDRRICWTTVGGDLRQTGNVTFERLDDAHTRVTIQLDWQPGGLVEKAGSLVGVDSTQVKADAERFKSFIEERSSETGAWRGEVGHDGRVGHAGQVGETGDFGAQDPATRPIRPARPVDGDPM